MEGKIKLFVSIIIILIIGGFFVASYAFDIPTFFNQRPTSCGNEVLESGEECDAGKLNGVECDPSAAGICSYCNSKCKIVNLEEFSCADGIQNGDETGIDCGGSCLSCESSSGEDLVSLVTNNTKNSGGGGSGGGGGGGGGGQDNNPPTVLIVSPVNGAQFNEGDNIPVSAVAADSDGSVTWVEFYNNGVLSANDTTSPYGYTWTNAQFGSYSLTAKAYDNEGASTVSSLINVNVNPPEICGNGVCASTESCNTCPEDCGPCPPSNGSLYSAAYPLTWPPPLTNLDKVGAESNPTGNPIGGYHGYDRIVHPSQATYVVYNTEQFVDLFEFDDYRNQVVQEGDIVYVDDNAVIDLTGVWGLFFPANITLASGRGRDFSKGALIKNMQQIFGPEGGRTLFIMGGPNIRVTGLRIEGPDKSTQKTRSGAIFHAGRADLENTYYEMGITLAFASRYPFFEFDNNEIYGWSLAVNLGHSEPEFGTHWAYGGLNPTYGYNSSMNAWVHHNYMHHNVRAGWGYGVSVSGFSPNTSVSTLIEGNLFNRNRHAVSSNYNNDSSYHARYNYILEEGTHSQFDRHGGGTGNAGLYTVIHHNTDMMPPHGGRGTAGIIGPAYPPGVSRVYNNWVKHSLRLGNAIGADNSEVFGNSLNVSPPQGTVLAVPVLAVDKDNVKINEVVSFSASDSVAGSSALSYACWDFGDNSEEVCDFVYDVKMHSYSQPGRYLVTLKLVDVKGVPAFETKSVVVHPSNPDAVVLSFWQRDSYNQYSTDDAPGYFKKRVLVDNHVVWERDVYDDGWEWEQVVVDITPYVSDTSVIDFQVQSLQNYSMQLYPAYHPFEFFELYLDDIYIFNRDYSVENFGDWEADVFSLDYMQTPTIRFNQTGAAYFYKVGDPWWIGSAWYESKNSGKFAFMIDSGYRESSTAGTTRGVKQTIRAPVGKTLVDVRSNDKGVLRDSSSYQRAVSFAGSVDGSNNLINDFSGYSKRLGGNNYASVSGVDLSQNWVLDMNVFIPYVNSQQTLMYASSGSNYVHVYYSPTNQVVLKTNSAEVSCDLPLLSHNRFNKIIVGRSCVGSTCTLSCASNGVINQFTNPNAVITLSGTSAVNFGGYSGGTFNLFGAINYAKILRSGSLSSSAFADLSNDKLQGAWYFRDNTGGVIKDASVYGKNVSVPSGWNFGSEGQRAFATITSSNPRATIPRDSSMVLGDDFSVEFVARFNNVNQNFIAVDGLPFRLYNEGWIDPGWPASNRLQLVLKLSDNSLYISDPTWYGWHGVSPMDVFENDKWYHIVFTKEGNYLRAYVNGKVNKKFFMPGVPYDSTSVSDLLLGGFDGDVQRFVTWDKALTDADVEELYKSSSLVCSDSDSDGYGAFPRSGVINGCRFDGFDCDDSNAGVYYGAGCS